MDTPSITQKYGGWVSKHEPPDRSIKQRFSEAGKTLRKTALSVSCACALSVAANAQQQRAPMGAYGPPADTITEQSSKTTSDRRRHPGGLPGAEVENDRGAHTKPHVDRMLDTMLRTERIPPGTPLSERIGQVKDPRLMPMIRSIDAAIGGRVEWPHVSVRGNLAAHNLDGLYHRHAAGDGRTPSSLDGSIELAPGKGPLAVLADPGHNASRNAGPSGIQLDKGLVDRYFAGERLENENSLRSVLVHELQHATSDDGQRALSGVTDPSESAFAETKAQMATLVAQEMVNRGDDGPKLNELPDAERRELLANTIGPHLDDEWRNANQSERDEMLHEILTADDYLLEGPWNESQRYMFGKGEHDIDGPGQTLYVPPGANEAERAARVERHERYRDQAAQTRPSTPDGRPEIGNRPSAAPTPTTKSDRPHPYMGPQTPKVDGPVRGEEPPASRNRLQETTPRQRQKEWSGEEPAAKETPSRVSPKQAAAAAALHMRNGAGPAQTTPAAATSQADRQQAQALAARRLLNTGTIRTREREPHHNRESRENNAPDLSRRASIQHRADRATGPVTGQRARHEVPVRPTPFAGRQPSASRSVAERGR